MALLSLFIYAEETAARLGVERFKTIKDALPDGVTYGEIRLVLARLRSTQSA